MGTLTDWSCAMRSPALVGKANLPDSRRALGNKCEALSNLLAYQSTHGQPFAAVMLRSILFNFKRASFWKH
jgi:hypothetical protein